MMQLQDKQMKKIKFKTCDTFTKCISRINNTDIDNAHDIDIVMPMYSLIAYSDNYSKTSVRLWQYYRDEPNNSLKESKSFKSKVKMTGKLPDDGNTKDVEIIVPLKYLGIFWRTLEMPLIVINLIFIFGLKIVLLLVLQVKENLQ